MKKLHAFIAAALCVAVPMVGCSASEGAAVDEEADPIASSPGDVGEIESGLLVGADERAEDVEAPDTSAYVAGVKLRTMADLNLRAEGSPEGAIQRVMMVGSEVTLVDPKVENGFVRVEHDGVQGFGSVKYLEVVEALPDDGEDGLSTAAVAAAAGPSPADTIARAKASVGFSYWWGHGAWRSAGPTSSTKGSCRGSCPNCSHSGSYGADCSGMVAKAWRFGAAKLETNSHPYSTADFIRSRAGKWKIINRSSIKKGDALVHHSGGAGHIVIYEKGDAWKTPTVYECKGCAAGCVHDTRSFGSAYKAIRRNGF
ncbi:SH3 domain-containing protein [Pendulispora albinea]|uniref:SH3 domain-containing protein n=1 Tax=Pendulispora albinea TaxID=2741071 RepID=A0ABZ2M082_9BACT